MGGLNLSNALDDLVRRILAGEVVFFVGAGFSVDSEGLTAERLMRRLVLRLHALDRMQPPEQAGRALPNLARMFGVSPTLKEIAAGTGQFRRLAQYYYEVNEWMCRMYGDLVVSAARQYGNDLAAFGPELAAGEQGACEESGIRPADEPFQPLPVRWLEQKPGSSAEQRALGKLVFVQTLGFFDNRVMAGTPFPQMQDAAAVRSSYRDRLRPRHHVIARLAREGLCPTLVTTNFDLLLEGALRLAGLTVLENDPGDPTSTQTAPGRFQVIASPQEFFRRGLAYRNATLLKIHGCAGQLRTLEGQIDDLLKYLVQLVYTYREIQNWRDDTWAADYLRTLLRTRTMVFAGYSTADPVMHDTFRSTYEDMEGKTVASRTGSKTGADAREAPAYFLAYSDDKHAQEFHGNEVLIAASRTRDPAAGIQMNGDHPNYLRFAGVGRSPLTLPNLDELLPLLQHEVLRRQQADALKSELAALIARLNRRRPPDECVEIRESFDKLVKQEQQAIRSAPDTPAARRALRHAIGWSAGFHSALRREWARGLILSQSPGQYEAVRELEHPLWYFPASERPAWTAWSAVVELALRELGRLALRRDGHTTATAVVEPTAALRPTVFLPETPEPTSPVVSLTLQLRGFERPMRRPEVPGQPSRKVIWLFHADALPWQRTDGANASPDSVGYRMGVDAWRPQPAASVIWRLALGQSDVSEVDQLLCRSNSRPT